MNEEKIPITGFKEEKPKLFRSLTVYEEACKIDFIKLDSTFDDQVASTTARIADNVREIEDSIIKQVSRLKILENGSTARIKNVIIAPGKLSDGVRHIRNSCVNAFAYVYLEGRANALTEVETSLHKKIKFSEASGVMYFVLHKPGYDIIDEFDERQAHFADIVDMTPKESLDQFRRRVPMTKRQYSMLLDMAKGRAFTVAGIVEKDMLRTVQELLYKAIREGATVKDFGFALKKANVKYTGTVYGTDAKKGEPISPIHTETIIRTNFASVYSDGRWDLFNDPAVVSFVPAYQYSGILDSRIRETHRKMDSRIYPRDDPIWKKWRPPNGYNCRCILTPVTVNMDYTVSNPTALKPDPGFGSLV